MQFKSWSAWKTVAAFGLVGILAAVAVTMMIPHRYVSTAVIRTEEPVLMQSGLDRRTLTRLMVEADLYQDLRGTVANRGYCRAAEDRGHRDPERRRETGRCLCCGIKPGRSSASDSAVGRSFSRCQCRMAGRSGEPAGYSQRSEVLAECRHGADSRRCIGFAVRVIRRTEGVEAGGWAGTHWGDCGCGHRVSAAGAVRVHGSDPLDGSEAGPGGEQCSPPF